MRSRRALLALLLCFSLVPRAEADAAAEARFWDGRAREAFERRDYDRALALFLESHRAAPSAGALYNIGVSAMLAHEEGLAYAHFDEFLASSSIDEARRADATRRMEEMESRLARVRVTTDPPGARVLVDRETLGEFGRTPRTIVVDPGAHTVMLSLDGHEPRSVPVDVARGAIASVEEHLAPILGTLTVSIEPSAATISAIAEDGREVAVTAGENGLALGRWRIRAEAEGFVGREIEAVVRSTPSAVTIALERIPTPMGRLLVDTGAVSGRVIVDGSPRASSPAAIEIEAGHHAVRVEADGYQPWEGEVDVEAGHARFVDLVLVRAE